MRYGKIVTKEFPCSGPSQPGYICLSTSLHSPTGTLLSFSVQSFYLGFETQA